MSLAPVLYPGEFKGVKYNQGANEWGVTLDVSRSTVNKYVKAARETKNQKGETIAHNEIINKVIEMVDEMKRSGNARYRQKVPSEKVAKVFDPMIQDIVKKTLLKPWGRKNV